MRDETGTILYIGKASNLRQRVRSYFGSTDARPQVRFLMARVTTIDFTVTDTEKEALLLENTLIKQLRPRYNLNLKDDKTYFSLQIDLKDPFPRFHIVRKLQRDGTRYFGPYSSAAAAREVVRQIQRIFPLRHYPWKSCQRRTRPCLYYQLGQCSAPCHGKISSADYRLLVQDAVLFLEGKKRDLVVGFRQRMKDAAGRQQYEEAARWRDLLRAIETTLERQKMVRQGGDSDVLGLARSGEQLALVLLFVRGGCISGSITLHGSGELDDSGAIAAFIQHYYTEQRYIPDALLLPAVPDDVALLEELLTERKGQKVCLAHPKRGEKSELVGLAGRNAWAALADKDSREKAVSNLLEELQRKLDLPAPPRRIECYDISTLQGRNSVGSGITFLDGAPDKNQYRRYRIKEIAGQDDFGMLKEVFMRRFAPRRVTQWGLPDLVIVDGGIGQLNSALAALEEIGIAGQFSLASLAKSRLTGDGKDCHIVRTEERVFLPGRRNPVRLRQDSAPLKLLAAIRDEAHRFAITYHRSLRDRNTLLSGLRDIPGIGQKLEHQLLIRFGSLEGVRQASAEDLAGAEGIGIERAEAILHKLKNGSGLTATGAD